MTSGLQRSLEHPLPLPQGDLREWAASLVAVLTELLVPRETNLDATVLDTSGRSMIAPNGLYAYDSAGNALISPNSIDISNQAQSVNSTLTAAISSTFETLSSVTMTSVGGTVLFTASAVLVNDSGVAVRPELRLLRDATTLLTTDPIDLGATNPTSLLQSFIYPDAAAAGSHTWSLQAKAAAGTAKMRERATCVLELRA